MNSYKGLRKKTIFSLLIALSLITSCSSQGGNGGNQSNYRTTVSAVIVERKDVIQSITVSGKIEGQYDVMLSFKSGGRVLQVKVEEGDTVRKGDIIAILEQTDYYAQYLQAQASYDQAEADYNRMKELYAENLISAQNFQSAETGFQSAKAALMLAQSSISGSNIRAPFDGIISYRNIDPMEMAGPGTPYFGLVDMDSVIIKLGITSERIGTVKIGFPVSVKVDAYPGKFFQGYISSIFPSADHITGKFTIEVSVPNPTGELKPGLIAICGVEIGRFDDVIAIPLKSLLLEENEYHVFLSRNSNAEKVIISVENIDDSIAVIQEGLSEGDTLIITGHNYLEDGSLINCNVLSYDVSGEER